MKKINTKPSAEGKRSLHYAEAPRDCNEVKINTKPGAEGKRSLHYAGAQLDCKKFKLILAGCLIFSFLFLQGASAKDRRTTVAVVVDRITYEKAGPAVDAYVDAVGNPDRKGVLILDKWENPDSIRTALIKLYRTEQLEGAVLIGDIPVPMIRDAQHMTTAFKMDQRRDWKQSSVPSDRFYDDFDLKFDYLRRDGDRPLYHYYSLRADSPQQIFCDIYSARIKAPVVPGKDKYELISEYLRKAVEAKSRKKQISKILHFAGHGYNSESMNARIDEAVALGEQFPFIDKGGDLEYIDHTFDRFIKYRLLGALADPELDLAILHHHGADDTQYLNGSPAVSAPSAWIELARNYFRSKVRSAKDTAAVKKSFMQQYGISRAWLDDAFDKEWIEKDSLYSASMDIHISDLYGYEPAAGMIILDACYNGAFCEEDYIAAHYIFNPGNTIVVKANSVNTLQDTWTNELLGLLGWGVSAGNWAKGQMTLESHLFGDPTFCFAAREPEKIPGKNAGRKYDLDRALTLEKSNTEYWNALLHSPEADIRCLAIKMLCRNGALTSARLLEIQKNDPSAVVRLEAFMEAKELADYNFSRAVLLGLNDTYELTQRLAASMAAKNYDPSLMGTVAKMYLDPMTSVRVNYHLKNCLEGFDTQSLKEELKRIKALRPEWPSDETFESQLASIDRSARSLAKNCGLLDDPGYPVKEKRFTVSSQRNKCNPQSLEGMFRILESEKDQELRIRTAETLGWFRYSCKKGEIQERCRALLKTEKDEAVRKELVKTLNRLY